MTKSFTPQKIEGFPEKKLAKSCTNIWSVFEVLQQSSQMVNKPGFYIGIRVVIINGIVARYACLEDRNIREWVLGNIHFQSTRTRACCCSNPLLPKEFLPIGTRLAQPWGSAQWKFVAVAHWQSWCKAARSYWTVRGVDFLWVKRQIKYKWHTQQRRPKTKEANLENLKPINI
jgi:hypothetical protein